MERLEGIPQSHGYTPKNFQWCGTGTEKGRIGENLRNLTEYRPTHAISSPHQGTITYVLTFVPILAKLIQVPMLWC